MKLLLLGALAALLAVPASAQTRVGTTAAPFLTMNAGARTTALGGAGTAAVNGTEALLWNPGAAASAQRIGEGGVLLSHQELFADITQDVGALTVPIGAGVVGFHVVSVDYGRVDVTTEFDEDTGETYGASDLVAGLTYALPLTDRFTVGGTAKYVRQSIRDMAGTSVAFDLGFVLETPYLNGSRLAASIRNFGSALEMEGINGRVFVDPDPTNAGNNDQIPASYDISAWNLPLSFELGVSVPAIRQGNAEVRLMADVEQINDFELNGDFGAEARYVLGSVALAGRVGYQNLTAGEATVDAHLAYGAGIEVDAGRIRLGVDMAYVPFDFLGSTQLIDVRMTF
ncbi:PorV/PorQ family protein [Rubrivirga sp.]|uniref:PorV/PorQ family protein n=1 Tax=Rubrivirga sp. TaxID=1885344 RepID=UPI003B52DFE8